MSNGAPVMVSWRKARCSDALPSKRYYHTSVVHENSMYIFGGYDSSSRLNDLHRFNFTKRQWTLIESQGAVPGKRNSHSAVYWNGMMYVFGGWESNRNILNDVFEFNFATNTWREVPTTGDLPTRRLTHSAVVYKACMYVFGGWDGQNFLNDLHVLDLNTFVWSRITPTTSDLPRKRNAFTAVVYDDAMYVFGGYDGKFRMNDLHRFDFQAQRWSEVQPHSQPPEIRCYHSALVHKHCMYVFGGYTGTQNMNDVQVFHLRKRMWLPVDTSGEPPHIRNSHSASVYGTTRGTMFILGGYNKGQCDNDFYECSLPYDLDIPESQLTPQLRTMLNNQQFSDITFIVSGSPVFAHKNIICARSEYFRAMFCGQMQEASQSEVPISDVSHSQFLRFLQYLYTDQVDLESDALGLLQLADRFSETRLKVMCESHLKDGIDDENAAAMFHLADTYHALHLRQLALSYMVLHFDVVKTTRAFEELDAMLLVEVARAHEMPSTL